MVKKKKSKTEISDIQIDEKEKEIVLEAIERSDVNIIESEVQEGIEVRIKASRITRTEEILDALKLKNMIKELGHKVIVETIEGVISSIRALLDMLGDIRGIGRGTVRNPTLPTYAFPDFFVRIGNEIIPVEIKNKKRIEKRDEFQAQWYAAAMSALNGGFIRLFERIGDITIQPETFISSKTILIFPRLKTIRILKPLNIRQEQIIDAWKTKYIAITEGKIPLDKNTSYCSRCSYRNKCRTFETMELEEIILPATLEFGEQVLEKVNPDLIYIEWHRNKLTQMLLRSLYNVPELSKISELSFRSRLAIRKYVEEFLNENLNVDLEELNKTNKVLLSREMLELSQKIATKWHTIHHAIHRAFREAIVFPKDTSTKIREAIKLYSR